MNQTVRVGHADGYYLKKNGSESRTFYIKSRVPFSDVVPYAKLFFLKEEFLHARVIAF